MKRKLLNTIIVIVTLATQTTPALAEDVSSTNFKLLDVSITSGGDVSNATNYDSYTSLGDFSSDIPTDSTSYRLKGGTVKNFEPNVPKIACFETTTDGSSSCTTGPSYLNTGGMVRVCGPNGCYNRARFEIDAQSNPTDTVYGIQVATVSDFSSYKYISGTTGALIAPLTRTISDYKTKTSWESTSINLTGLKPNQQYWIRATALQGDFTETEPGPSATATTALPTISFDIDIANTSGAPASDPPHRVSFTLPLGMVRRANNLIWLNVNTNSTGGIELNTKGLNGGLLKTPSIITSATANLAVASKGFGLQQYSSSQLYQNGSGNGELGTFTVASNYNQGGDNVGIVPQTPTNALIYSSTAPLHTAKAGVYVMGKSDTSIIAGTYSETITFTLFGK